MEERERPACAAELYAAFLLDEGAPRRLYGCVTTGRDWQFLYFDGDEKRVVVDQNVYVFTELGAILGVLRHVIDESLRALAASRERVPKAADARGSVA